MSDSTPVRPTQPNSLTPADKGLVSKAPFHTQVEYVHRYADLGGAFFSQTDPTPLQTPPSVIDLNADALLLLGLKTEDVNLDAFTQVFSGCARCESYPAIASVYCGHQFGVFVSQLGDGRALLVAEVAGQTCADNPQGIWELQLKGAGKTPFSRMGDGRAVLRSSIREYLCAEAMHALGIPSTRSLAITASSDPVFRETTETASIVTRMAPSFIRFGHFEYFASTGQSDRLKALADFVIEHFYPDCQSSPTPYLALLAQVVERTAKLIAAWQSVGFCHGVMNTDNMSILGLTIDYGPFGFLDGFAADHICNHSDEAGRYAYNQQPAVGHWNLYALAQGLMPLLGQDIESVKGVLEGYWPTFEAAFCERMAHKLGFAEHHEALTPFYDDTFRLLHAHRTDFTEFFRRLSGLSVDSDPARANRHAPTHPDSSVRDLFLDRAAFDAWATQWRSRLKQAGVLDPERIQRQNATNPVLVLRNHLAQKAIEHAQGGDYEYLKNLKHALQTPFEDTPDKAPFKGEAPEWAQQLHVSCSS